MIYDEIKSWVKNNKKWSFVPGYLSHSLKKQTFYHDPLCPHMLHMAVYAEQDRRLYRWFKHTYADVLDELSTYFSEKHSADYYASYIILAKHGYLFDLGRNVVSTDFVNVGYNYLRHEGDTDRILSLYIFKYDNRLFLTWISYMASYVNRLHNSIDYTIDKIDPYTSLTKPTMLTNGLIHDLLIGVTDQRSAQKVLSVFLLYRFESDFLSAVFKDNYANQWFCDVLQRPLEDVIFEILAEQLDIPLSTVLTIGSLIGTDDISSLIDTLIQQRDTVFEPATEIDYDIVF